MTDYKIENIYQGGYSTLDPNKGYLSDFGGYRTATGSLGITTNPQTANVLKEVSSKLSGGLKQIELTLISPQLIDAVPKQQLEEVRRLSKLTGIDVTVHGPVIDTAGMSQQGFDEMSRQNSERVIVNTLERSYDVDPKGNVNVTFHTSEGLPGSEWKTLGEKGKEREFKKMIVVDRDSGKMVNMLQEEKRFHPGLKEIKEEIMTPEEGLDSINHTQWSNSLAEIEFRRENAERILNDSHEIFRKVYVQASTGKLDRELVPEEMEQIKKIHSAAEYMKEASLKANSLFSKAYEMAKKDDDEETMNYLSELSQAYGRSLGINEEGKRSIESLDPKVQSNAMYQLVHGLERVQPKLFVPLEDFALEKTAKTFGNAAFAAYKKFGNNSPIISIENPPVGHALSTGEDLKNVVEKSREEFKKRLIEEKKLNEKEANKIAEKLIGATWDVGHINMLRKQGFGKEEIIKESEKIKPFLKHVHLSDNFGMEHTELPMGMGNVPFKEIMEKLGKEGYEAKKVIEAGTWWQHFQTNPTVESLEGLGAPIYANGKTPYWNQALGFYQGYSSGLEGAWLPGNNYQTFGTYFSQLPTELGGQAPSQQGNRMSGRGME